jgi:hypothetical protein
VETPPSFPGNKAQGSYRFRDLPMEYEDNLNNLREGLLTEPAIQEPIARPFHSSHSAFRSLDSEKK